VAPNCRAACGARLQVSAYSAAAPNGIELSCRASRIHLRSNRFSAAGPVSCSELLGAPRPKALTQRHGPLSNYLATLAPAASRLPSRATALSNSPAIANLPARSRCLLAGPSLAGLAPTSGQCPTHLLSPTHQGSTAPPLGPHLWPLLPPLASPSPAKDPGLAASQATLRPSPASQVAICGASPAPQGQVARGGEAAHNGLELSCPAAQVTVAPFSRALAGKSRPIFPRASRVSCSELLGAILLSRARRFRPGHWNSRSTRCVGFSLEPGTARDQCGRDPEDDGTESVWQEGDLEAGEQGDDREDQQGGY
jgi:hypothetical protein